MKLTTFDFNEAPVRALLDDRGEPWFVAADVCRVLEHSNPSQAVAELDEDEKGISNGDTLGGAQKLIIISEAGLYDLIFRSRKPEAKAFRRWVTKEVLPAIRKTGRYALSEGLPDEASPIETAVEALESNAADAAAARARVLAGTMTVETAQMVSSLCAQVVRSWELRLKIKPEILPLALTEYQSGAELGPILQAIAATLEGGAGLRLAEIFALARERGLVTGELDNDRAKQFGRRLQQWRGHELTDGRGRAFRLKHHRTKEGTRYQFEFAGEESR